MKAPTLFLLLLLPLVLTACRRDAPASSAESGDTAVACGPLEVWTPLTGILDARRTETLFSRFQGRATVIEIVPDGAEVHPGDPLLRLDSSDVENELVRLNNELARTRAELDALENADLPIEQAEIAARLTECTAQAEAEQQALRDTRDLVERNLLSRRELEQQEARAAVAEAKARQLASQQKLTLGHLHPARLAKARAAHETAARQVESACRQLSNTVIRAPSAGLAVQLPVALGTEFRPVRSGDSVYPGQPLLAIPDLAEFVVQSFIPESDLGRVTPGSPARVTPLAYPDCRLEARVENLSATAQSRPGYPAWQKYFRVTTRISQGDPRLRPGMSVTLEVLSHSRTNAILVPRRAVTWENGTASCRVRTLHGTEIRPVETGIGNLTALEILRGLQPGEKVVLP